MIFYSGTYFNTKLQPQKHDIVHVEVFTGGPTGEQSIGARWQRGVVRYFDSYKFESTAYHSIKFHYKSIDTWLEGLCVSHCKEHKWQSANVKWAPGKKSIFSLDQGYDEADLDAPMLDNEEAPDEAPKKEPEKLCYLGDGNNVHLVKNALVARGFSVLPRGMQFSDNYRFKWTQTPAEVNFMKFTEGRHLANHFSNSRLFTNKIYCLENLEKLNRSLQFGDIKSSIYSSVSQFTPPTYRLDVVADLVSFLNAPNTGLWMIKNANSNQGQGINKVSDIGKYKDDLLNRKDKWGDAFKD